MLIDQDCRIAVKDQLGEEHYRLLVRFWAPIFRSVMNDNQCCVETALDQLLNKTEAYIGDDELKSLLPAVAIEMQDASSSVIMAG